MRSAHRLPATLVLAFALALALSGIAVAGAPERARDALDAERPDVSGPLSAEARTRAEIEAYWTPERMRRATERPERMVLERQPVPDDGATATPQGPEREYAPQAPPEHVARSADITTSLGDDVTVAWSYNRYELPAHLYTQWPYVTNGRVFFTSQRYGDSSCSGSVVTAPNRSTVWTAGHCVNDGGGGAWHTNWVFVPAYRDGNAPLGMWHARRLVSLTGWTQNGTFRYDLGAANVRPDASGWNLQDYTGAQGIRFNSSRQKFFHNFGYPAEPPFTGQRQFVCEAFWAANDSPPGSGPRTMGKGCDMTGGASGGGWHTDYGSGGGYLESVNSYKYESLPQRIYGPYHGDGAVTLYQNARQ